MRLLDLAAVPHPAGHRIDLAWRLPEDAEYPEVRVVRRAGSHPTTPDPHPELPCEGVVVADTTVEGQVTVGGDGVFRASDRGLRGETVYYYTFFPYAGAGPEGPGDRRNRTAAMATAPYDFAGWMAELLPAIYHRYDTALPRGVLPPVQVAEMAEEDRERGQLRRFLDLPGGQLDLLYSYARALLSLHDRERVDGRLLPLLAQWIGWKTDHRLGIDAQRRELRDAPALYRATGLVPTVEAAVKRATGWDCRTKELVHNVFLSNRPERLNLWQALPRPAGEGCGPAELLSLDFAFDGRPVAVRDGDGTLWIFYHTRRGGRWEIWCKQSPAFRVTGVTWDDLVEGPASEGLRRVLAAAGIPLSRESTVTGEGRRWQIGDAAQRVTYAVKAVSASGGGLRHLRVHRLTVPSRPLSGGGGIEKYPTAALQRTRLWLFWSVFDEAERKWRIRYRICEDGSWSPAATFTHGAGEADPERCKPAAAVRHGTLWLFWMERTGRRWQLRYNCHRGSAWLSDASLAFPADGGEDPRVEDDLSVVCNPALVQDPAVIVLWARREAGEPGQTRWSVALRAKRNAAPGDTGWAPVYRLPKEPGDHDREPVAVFDLSDRNLNLGLYWSSTRGGGWSLWRTTLKVKGGSFTPGTAERLSDSPFSERAPCVLGGLLEAEVLIYRSNRSLTYRSELYRGTETVDSRYAGATTVDARNAAKIELGGEYEDFQTYTFDAGGDRCGRAVGLYLEPDTVDPGEIERVAARLRPALADFLPLTDRAVLITPADDLALGDGLGPGEDFSDELETSA